jgi:hypothetical protein
MTHTALMPRNAVCVVYRQLVQMSSLISEAGFQRVPLDTVLKSGGFAIAKDCERISLSAFCGVGGAKWGEGRGEVLRLSI